MSSESPLQELPQSFRDEQRELVAAGIDTWGALQQLSDHQLSQLSRRGRASARNFKRLRGMAELVCCLDLAPADAALLMHAGLATVAALSAASPRMSSRVRDDSNASSEVDDHQWWIWRWPNAGSKQPKHGNQETDPRALPSKLIATSNALSP